jgi:hypothetical protein
MVINMQNYLIINQATNIVENTCVWDGNTQTWSPPANYLALIQATTPAVIWVWNDALNDTKLQEQLGQGGVGFTWDGTKCITNQPKPLIPEV